VTAMKIAVLGTGPVGQAIAGRLAELGHDVTVGTRDPEATRTRTDDSGTATYAAWQQDHPAVALATFEDAARGADLVVNAAGGNVSLDILDQAGDEHLADKVLLDISNPLDHSQGFPPRLFVKDDDSLAEMIQRAHPRARVVKALNTLTSSLMVHPETLGEETTVFVSGDDAGAKATVVGLLGELGHTDVIDLGDLSTARGAEMWLPFWIRIAMALGGSDFNIKVVRGAGVVNDR
jgi:NADPH-dependent F420 reductase